jgi:hypothetical protein
MIHMLSKGEVEVLGKFTHDIVVFLVIFVVSLLPLAGYTTGTTYFI